ncbi:hypothetical protein [Legionella sp. WA2022007384]
MAKNTLFNFLSLHKTTVQFPQGHKLELDTNKNGHYYFRVICPNQEKLVITVEEKEYLLENHHISVYENECRDDPKLNQYHYTAELRNKAGECYRLHVYFNAFDEHLNSTFEQKIGANYKLVDIKNPKNQFLTLALKHTEPLLKQLRQQHNEVIRALEHRYTTCDELLSKYFEFQEKDANELLVITTEACEILRKILPLVRSSYYSKLLSFHETTTRALQERLVTPIEHPPQIQAKEPEKNTTSEVDTETPLASSITQTSSLVILSSLTPKQVEKSDPKIISQLKLELTTLKSEFTALSMAPRELKAKKIEDLLAKTYEIGLIFEKVISIDELEQLQKIRRELYIIGANLLPALLFENQFELASLLTSFHHLLHAEKFLNLALQKRNSKMLDFILTYGDLDLNNQPVTVQKKQYPSPVQACFYENTPSTPMNDCLAILIQHGANLLAPDEKGLPLVYSILIDELHPLQKVLFMNREKTIDSVEFIKKLIALLRAHLTRGDISPADANSTESEVKSFEQHLEFLQNDKLNNPSIRLLIKQGNQLENKYLNGLRTKLKNDPDIANLNREVQQTATELTLRLTKAQQRQAKLRASEHLDDLEQLFEKFDTTDLDFDTLKKAALKQLNKDLSLLTKKIELCDVQQELIGTRPTSKSYRRLRSREAGLLQEIHELQKETARVHNPKYQEAADSDKKVSTLLLEFSELFSSSVKISKTLSKQEEGNKKNDFSALSNELEQLSTLMKKS